MKYIKFTQYLYLAATLFFIFDAYKNWDAETKPWFSIFLAAMALFMFFFRRRYAKRFEERNDKSE
jgi:hypothetical protein